MSYSVVSKDSLSDEYGHLVHKEPEDPEDPEDPDEEEEEEEPSSTCCRTGCSTCCRELDVTLATVMCVIFLIELVIFAYWIGSCVWTRDHEGQEGSGPGPGPGPGLEGYGEEEGESDYSFLSARLSRITEGHQDKDQDKDQIRYNHATYVGKSADEFVEFLGLVLLIYLFIKCMCGPYPRRK